MIAERPALFSTASLGRPAAPFRVMQLCHTQTCHTQLFDTQLSHTQLFHTPLFHTHNSFTRSSLKLSILHHLLCLPCLFRIASTTFSDYWKKLTCEGIRSLILTDERLTMRLMTSCDEFPSLGVPTCWTCAV